MLPGPEKIHGIQLFFAGSANTISLMWLLLPGLIVELAGITILVAGLVTDSLPVTLAGVVVIGAAVAVHISRIRNGQTFRDADNPQTTLPAGKPPLPDEEKILYEDRLVIISENAITFRNYSLLMRSRRVPFADIDHIDILEPSLTTGKWRLWGSGNFTMWFPLDGGRSSRDTIFHAFLRTRGMNIGFTVENSGAVVRILREYGLIGRDARMKIR